MAQPQPRWTTAAELGQVDVPPGGTTDQVLAKNSNADRDLKWTDAGGGGGGSFLSANIARVDPSGNDGTGEVGDLTKPFLTVQAALDAIVDNDLGGSVFGGVIYLPATTMNEVLTMTATGDNGYVISFIGQRGPDSYTFRMFQSITVTKSAESNPVLEIFLENGSCEGVTTDVDTVYIFLRNFDFTGTNITLSGTGQDATIGSFDSSGGNIDNIAAMGASQVSLFGIFAKHGGTSIACNGSVEIANCRSYPSKLSYSGFNVDDGSGSGNLATVVAAGLGTVLGDVTAGDITLKDARSNGTLTSESSITYDDFFLKGVPPGGTTGQVLDKVSGDDFDTQWNDLA